MCGPSGDQTATERSTASFTSMLQKNYGQLFSDQLSVLNGLKSSLTPIVAAGPAQLGFSGPELAALQTQSVNAAGAAARSAEQAARTFGAGEGGGATSGVTSGITKQIESAIASNAAGQLGQQQTNINLADFNQGNQNYWRAVGGAQALGAELSPNAAASGALTGGQETFNQATEINQENNAMAQDIAGFAAGAIGAAPGIFGAYKKAFGGGGASAGGAS